MKAFAVSLITAVWILSAALVPQAACATSATGVSVRAHVTPCVRFALNSASDVEVSANSPWSMTAESPSGVLRIAGAVTELSNLELPLDTSRITVVPN